MKTDIPLILTATVAPEDLAQFDALRRQHFPPERNLLSAHLTMFHRLPGEKRDDILPVLSQASAGTGPIIAEVSGLMHLGAGVAFRIASPALERLRGGIKAQLAGRLNPQDEQRWQPHVTIQNKVGRDRADALLRQLSETFVPHSIAITGMDLWLYRGGPWDHEASFPLTVASE